MLVDITSDADTQFETLVQQDKKPTVLYFHQHT